MLYFQLPSYQCNLYQCLSTIFNNDEELLVSHSLSYYLKDIKHKIDPLEKKWDIFKRYTNPYEYIHTNVPEKKKSVCKYYPLSLSYFKMI